MIQDSKCRVSLSLKLNLIFTWIGEHPVESDHEKKKNRAYPKSSTGALRLSGCKGCNKTKQRKIFKRAKRKKIILAGI